MLKKLRIAGASGSVAPMIGVVFFSSFLDAFLFYAKDFFRFFFIQRVVECAGEMQWSRRSFVEQRKRSNQ